MRLASDKRSIFDKKFRQCQYRFEKTIALPLGAIVYATTAIFSRAYLKWNDQIVAEILLKLLYCELLVISEHWLGQWFGFTIGDSPSP